MPAKLGESKMKSKSAFLILSCLTLTLTLAGPSEADNANCVIVSAGAQMETTPGALHNVGQVAIGLTSGGGIEMHVGGIHCLSMGILQCLKGDVDINGLIDGQDIDDYVRVTITGSETALEKCAAGISVPDFVELLLNQ